MYKFNFFVIKISVRLQIVKTACVDNMLLCLFMA